MRLILRLIRKVSNQHEWNILLLAQAGTHFSIGASFLPKFAMLIISSNSSNYQQNII
jgi:hypothetical protein